MDVYAGEHIQEINSGRKLRVEHDFDKTTDVSTSHSFDFLARYVESRTTRGFLMADEGTTWRRT